MRLAHPRWYRQNLEPQRPGKGMAAFGISLNGLYADCKTVVTFKWTLFRTNEQACWTNARRIWVSKSTVSRAGIHWLHSDPSCFASRNDFLKTSVTVLAGGAAAAGPFAPYLLAAGIGILAFKFLYDKYKQLYVFPYSLDEGCWELYVVL